MAYYNPYAQNPYYNPRPAPMLQAQQSAPKVDPLVAALRPAVGMATMGGVKYGAGQAYNALTGGGEAVASQFAPLPSYNLAADVPFGITPQAPTPTPAAGFNPMSLAKGGAYALGANSALKAGQNLFDRDGATSQDIHQAATAFTAPTVLNQAFPNVPINQKHASTAGYLAAAKVIPAIAPFALGMAGLNELGVDIGFGSGKSKEQRMRDSMRSHFQDTGLFDEDWNLQLADGTLYDMGRDGGKKLQGGSFAGRESGERFTHDVDWSKDYAGDLVGNIQPVLNLMFGDAGNQFVGHFVNAATSNADNLEEAQANARHIFGNMGLDRDTIYQGVQERFKDDPNRDAYLAGTDNLYGIENPDAEVVI